MIAAELQLNLSIVPIDSFDRHSKIVFELVQYTTDIAIRWIVWVEEPFLDIYGRIEAFTEMDFWILLEYFTSYQERDWPFEDFMNKIAQNLLDSLNFHKWIVHNAFGRRLRKRVYWLSCGRRWAMKIDACVENIGKFIDHQKVIRWLRVKIFWAIFWQGKVNFQTSSIH